MLEATMPPQVIDKKSSPEDVKNFIEYLTNETKQALAEILLKDYEENEYINPDELERKYQQVVKELTTSLGLDLGDIKTKNAIVVITTNLSRWLKEMKLQGSDFSGWLDDARDKARHKHIVGLEDRPRNKDVYSERPPGFSHNKEEIPEWLQKPVNFGGQEPEAKTEQGPQRDPFAEQDPAKNRDNVRRLIEKVQSL